MPHGRYCPSRPYRTSTSYAQTKSRCRCTCLVFQFTIYCFPFNIIGCSADGGQFENIKLKIENPLANVAQRQSSGFVNRRLWVRIPPLAFNNAFSTPLCGIVSAPFCIEAHVSDPSRAKQNAKTLLPSVPVARCCCLLGVDKSGKLSTALASCPVSVCVYLLIVRFMSLCRIIVCATFG